MRVFLAILKDSFRESIDNKVFLVLIAISILITLVAFSIGFDEVPFEEAISETFNRIEKNFNNGSSLVGQFVTQTRGFAPHLERLETIQAESGTTYRMIYSVKNPEKFLVEMGNPPGMKSKRRMPSYEGLFGAHRLVVDQLSTDGFSPASLFPAEESPGLYSYEVKPGPAFKTAGGTKMTFFFGLTDISLGPLSGHHVVFIMEYIIVEYIGGWVGVLVAIIFTAWFLPNMFRRGTVDMVLAKPTPRELILISKYLGGLFFVFLNASMLIGGTWLAFSVKSGYWHFGYLGSILTITFMFAILYSVSTFVAVLWRNTILCVIFPIGFWLIVFAVNAAHGLVNRSAEVLSLDVPSWIKTTVEVFYYILPSTSDLGTLSTYFMSIGTLPPGVSQDATREAFAQIPFATSVITSIAFIVFMLFLSCLVFRRKDF